MDTHRSGAMVGTVKPHLEHRQLCTIELIAEGHADRCVGEECAFWDRGCALTRIEYELDGRPDVARLLFDLRRELESGRELEIEEVHARFAHILNEDEGIFDAGAGGETTAKRETTARHEATTRHETTAGQSGPSA